MLTPLVGVLRWLAAVVLRWLVAVVRRWLVVGVLRWLVLGAPRRWLTLQAHPSRSVKWHRTQPQGRYMVWVGKAVSVLPAAGRRLESRTRLRGRDLA